MSVCIFLRADAALIDPKTGNTWRVNTLSICMVFTSSKRGKQRESDGPFAFHNRNFYAIITKEHGRVMKRDPA